MRWHPVGQRPAHQLMAKAGERLPAGTCTPCISTASSACIAEGMNINEQEFVAVTDDTMAALAANDIEPATGNEAFGILWSLEPEVVRL